MAMMAMGVINSSNERKYSMQSQTIIMEHDDVMLGGVKT